MSDEERDRLWGTHPLHYEEVARINWTFSTPSLIVYAPVDFTPLIESLGLPEHVFQGKDKPLEEDYTGL